MWRHRIGAALVCAAAAALCGCSAEDPRLLELRDRYAIASEPTGAEPVSAVVETGTRGDLALVGQIDAGEFDPFSAGQASFVVTDPAAKDDHGAAPGHDPKSCPFCKRRAQQAARAVVKFVDERGNVLPHDARELFALAAGDVVVVRGRGEFNPELDRYEVTATKIYRRP